MFVLTGLIFACRAAPVAPTPVLADPCGEDVAPTSDALTAFGVEIGTGDDARLEKRYSAASPRFGERFAVVDDVGLVGIVTATSTDSVRSCGSCGCSTTWQARWDERASRTVIGTVDAVGPFRESFRGILRLVPEVVHGDIGSPVPISSFEPRRTQAAWDLTGDGRADLEAVIHVCSSEHALAFELWEARPSGRVLTSREADRRTTDR